jgi:zinc/manganese transport system substrate-binding protein
MWRDRFNIQNPLPHAGEGGPAAQRWVGEGRRQLPGTTQTLTPTLSRQRERERFPIIFALVLALWVIFTLPAAAQTPQLSVVASFSVLGDVVAQVGGPRVRVTTLVGPEADAHVFRPSARDARTLANADLVFTNGLGFEGWLPRMLASTGAQARTVELGKSITPLLTPRGRPDPHVWQDPERMRRYVAVIATELGKRDPAGAALYQARAKAYDAQLLAVLAEGRQKLAAIPPAQRTLITSHDAFAYLAARYGLTVVTARGLSTQAEGNAKAVATLIERIERQRIRAVFHENVTDPRLIARISKETGAKVGGTLYSDALSKPGGKAPTYLDMMRHNLHIIASALSR